MKCPFRKIITTTNRDFKNKTVEEFAECIENECPFFGEKINRFDNATLRYETVILPICKRAKGGAE